MVEGPRYVPGLVGIFWRNLSCIYANDMYLQHHCCRIVYTIVHQPSWKYTQDQRKQQPCFKWLVRKPSTNLESFILRPLPFFCLMVEHLSMNPQNSYDSTRFPILCSNSKHWRYQHINKKDTPTKINIVPENGWLEDYFPIGKVTLRGPC